MSWADCHSLSEELSGKARQAAHAGEHRTARELYRRAAEAEAAALAALTTDKARTRGITAVSGVALWYKAHEFGAAEALAYQVLADRGLPTFARAQLRDLLQLVWTAESAERAGLEFVPGDVIVAVKGGEVVHGGAPLDLILRKVESVQSFLYRTVEMLVQAPLRRRGAPSGDVQTMFRPWLFQAPAGSYQFSVRVQGPKQQELFEADRPKVEPASVTETFFRILRAAASDPDAGLSEVVPVPEYREVFLSLARGLAPTGKSYELLEVREAGLSEPVASFGTDTRREINEALKKSRPPKPPQPADETVLIRGVLRALHLDKDWLEVARGPLDHVTVEEAGDVLDDVVGPMVNRPVVLTAVRRGKKLLYRDIELEE